MGGDRWGAWDGRTHVPPSETDNQQGPTLWPRERCSIFCNNPSGKEPKERMGVCMTESLRCTLKVTAALLISYAPT